MTKTTYRPRSCDDLGNDLAVLPPTPKSSTGASDPAALTAVFDFSDEIKYSDFSAQTTALDGESVATVANADGQTFSAYAVDKGLVWDASSSSLIGDGLDTAFVVENLGRFFLYQDFLLVLDITPTDFNNRVVFTVDNALESARYRAFLSGTEIRLDLNGAITGVTIPVQPGDRFSLAFAFVGSLVSIWVDGVLAAEDLPFDRASLVIPVPRVTLYADISQRDDARNVFLGQAHRVAIRKVVV